VVKKKSSVSWLPRKYRRLYVSQPYGPPQPVTGTALPSIINLIIGAFRQKFSSNSDFQQCWPIITSSSMYIINKNRFSKMQWKSLGTSWSTPLLALHTADGKSLMVANRVLCECVRCELILVCEQYITSKHYAKSDTNWRETVVS
jgi:hypothetical protein